MIDKEKVIDGLNCCKEPDHAWCSGCPYEKECDHLRTEPQLLADAEALLTEEPKVLSINEISKYNDVIIERKRLYGNNTLVYAATLAEIKITDESEFISFKVGPMLPIYEYGSWWRCWDERPNEEQMMAVKWDVHYV